MQIYEDTAKTYFFDGTFQIFLKHKESHEGNDLWNWFKHLGLPFGPRKDIIRGCKYVLSSSGSHKSIIFSSFVYGTFFGSKLG